MKAAFLLLLLFSTPALAGDFSWEIGGDVLHAAGVRVWSISLENDNSRFRIGSIGQNGVELKFYAAEHVWHPTPNLAPSFGLVHLERTTRVNGLHWNFIIGLRYRLSKKVFLGFLHYSHGRGLGIAEDKTNRGWNLITIGSRF